MKKLNLDTLNKNMFADAILIIDLFQLFKAWSTEEKRLYEKTKTDKKYKSYYLGQCASLNMAQRDLKIFLQAHNLRKNYERKKSRKHE